MNKLLRIHCPGKSVARVLLLALVLTAVRSSASAQDLVVREAVAPGEDLAPLTLTLDDAIQIALTRSYALRQNNLDFENAAMQVRQVYGSAYPQLSLNSNYQRNIVTPNPFAGSDAGGFFSSLTYVDWLKYNEDQRLDNDPTTGPITLEEYRNRQQAGLDAANITLNPSTNPFQIDNQWSNVVALDQVIYDGAVFSGIKGAKVYRDISEASYVRQTQLIVNQVKVAFFGAIFAAEQAKVVQKSVERTGRTADEAQKRLVQGVASKYDVLSAQVEKVNLESDLVRVQNALENSLDQLKMILGVPIEQPIILRGSLEGVEQGRLVNVSLDDALQRALAQRPDLEQASLSIELQKINQSIQKSARYPSLRAFVNAGYVGSVPTNRQVVSNPGDDPFTFQSTNLGFFDGSYWNATAAVGLTLRWKIFDGRQTSSKIQQARIEQERAEIVYEQLLNQVKREIEEARREVFAAERRMTSQSANVQRAELNYQFASTRLQEGVSTRLDERQASTLLDDSRLNYNRAVFDYLVAQANFETAVGNSVASLDDGMTSLMDQ